MIPISAVRLGPDVEAQVLEVLRSGTIAQGPKVAELEERFAARCGVEHAVAVSSGTTALVAALTANGIGSGDEVITSPFTFVATVNAVLEVGATVRFADIDATDFGIDPVRLAETVGPATRAVVPVHLYGQCADMDAITAETDRHGIVVVEDAAQAYGATLHGHPAGSWGTAAFSLYATKNVAAGEGGVVTTADPAVADRVRLLRNQGMRERYSYEVAGHNWRMTDLQAAVALPQLDGYHEQLARRRANAAALTAGLGDVDGLVVPRERPGREHVWHQYTIRVTPDAAVTRDEVIASLGADGVGSGVYYPRVIADYDCYRADPRIVGVDTPVARRCATEVLSLPVHPHLAAGDLEQIVAAVRRALRA